MNNKKAALELYFKDGELHVETLESLRSYVNTNYPKRWINEPLENTLKLCYDINEIACIKGVFVADIVIPNTSACAKQETYCCGDCCACPAYCSDLSYTPAPVIGNDLGEFLEDVYTNGADVDKEQLIDHVSVNRVCQ